MIERAILAEWITRHLGANATSRRASRLPSMRKARATTRASAGVGASISRLFHSARAPYSSGSRPNSSMLPPLGRINPSNIRSDVVTDDLRGVVLCGARHGDRDRGRALDHMIVRQHLTRRGENDARARRSAALPRRSRFSIVGRPRLCIGTSYDCREPQKFLASCRDGSCTSDQFNQLINP